MRKVSVVLQALAVIGVVVLSVTVAYAGGGQGGGSNELSAFQCYLIDGDQPPAHVLNLVDQFGTRENVQVGRGRLLCAPVTGTKPEGTLPATFDPLPDGADHLTCYTVSPFERRPSGRLGLFDPDAVVDLTDELDVAKGVKVSIPAFVCTLSKKACVSGADCPLPEP